MAVSIQGPLYTIPNMWSMGEPPDTFPTTASEGQPLAPAYQYPLPSNSIIPTYTDLPPHSEASGPNQDPSTSRNKGGPLMVKTAKIKRSISTPNVRGQASADAAAMAISAEKRRNKLGYHRTSVACGHCRRRKIRCIPAQGDAQNRCTNCIRLKKECNFFPVEQQPPQSDAKRRGSKTQSSSGRASGSPSPSVTSSQVPELPHPYPPLNMAAVHELGGPQVKRQRTESFSPDNKAAPSARNFEYSSQAHTNWMAPDISPGTRQPTDQHGYWRINSQESPITPGFSPFTPSMTPHSTTWSAHTESGPRDDIPWSVPQRSISFSNLEGLHSHHPYSHYPPPPPVPEQYGGRSRVGQANMYPPSISTSASSHNAPDAHSASTTSASHHSQQSSLPSASISSASSYNSWQPPYGYGKPIGSAGEPYAPWTSPHGAHPHAGEGGHAPYGYGEPGAPLFYPPPPQPPNQGR